MADMVYEMNWVDMNKESQMKVLYILARTQKPLAIDAEPLYTLNYISFQSVSRFSLLFV